MAYEDPAEYLRRTKDGREGFCQMLTTTLSVGGTYPKWGTLADDFGRNQVRGRAEGRFQAGAIRPSGIVHIDLTPFRQLTTD